MFRGYGLSLAITLAFCVITSGRDASGAAAVTNGNTGVAGKISGSFHTGCVNKKHMALTFDDGPSTFTPDLLSLLARNQVKATFFQIGIHVDKNPSHTKSIHDAGHLMGSHTYSHKDCTTLTKEQLSTELKWTDEATYRAAGVVPVLFRYPQGRFNNATDDIVINKHGKVPVSWNVDTQDWQFHSVNAHKIFGDFPTQVKTYANDTGVISVFHSELHAESMNSVQDVINWGKNNGYTFVRVDECIGYQGDVYMRTATVATLVGEIAKSSVGNEDTNVSSRSVVANMGTVLVITLITSIISLLL